MDEIEWMAFINDGSVKKEINNLIHTYGNKHMTLEEVENLAEHTHTNFIMAMQQVDERIKHKEGL